MIVVCFFLEKDNKNVKKTERNGIETIVYFYMCAYYLTV
jgi:hypothetical protein